MGNCHYWFSMGNIYWCSIGNYDYCRFIGNALQLLPLLFISSTAHVLKASFVFTDNCCNRRCLQADKWQHKKWLPIVDDNIFEFPFQERHSVVVTSNVYLELIKIKKYCKKQNYFFCDVPNVAERAWRALEQSYCPGILPPYKDMHAGLGSKCNLHGENSDDKWGRWK